MANITANKDFVVYNIKANDNVSCASFVPELGGVVSSLQLPGVDGERELLHQHDFFWQCDNDDLAGGMPFLFPVCARLSRNNQDGVYSYQGQHYKLPIHGFSWQLPWDVVEHGDDFIVMQLESNASTLKQYPFDFCIQLRYEIRNGQLFCYQSYENRSGEAMPYYAGFHPYFSAASKDNIEIDYEPIERWQYNSALTDLVGRKANFSLPTKLANPDLNEQLTKVGENKTVNMIYENSDILQVEAQGLEDHDLFPFIQLYTIVDKNFFCIEPWMGYPNAMNAVKGVRWLQPNQQEHGLLRIELKSEAE